MRATGLRHGREWLAAGWAENRSVALQSFSALSLNTATSLVAGAFLASVSDTFREFPGLLVLVPAAIGLRGNVFTAFGSRLSTAIHTGNYSTRLRPGTVLGDNVLAALGLSTGVALALAILASIVASAFRIEGGTSTLTMATISIAGSLIASVAVLGATVGLTRSSVRFGWDLDNLVAPVVSTLGDVLTIPALYLATGLVTHGTLSTGLGWTLVILAVSTSVAALFSRWPGLRTITRESWPVLVVAGLLSTLAGLTIEHQLDTFDSNPELLSLVPAFISSAGALGGILSSRWSTRIHTGTLSTRGWPNRAARRDVVLIASLAVPVYVLNPIGAYVVAGWVAEPGASLGRLVAASLIGGVAVVIFAIAVAYAGALSATALRVDPDTYGTPLLTSSVDFLGALSLVTAATLVGITA